MFSDRSETLINGSLVVARSRQVERCQRSSWCCQTLLPQERVWWCGLGRRAAAPAREGRG